MTQTETGTKYQMWFSLNGEPMHPQTGIFKSRESAERRAAKAERLSPGSKAEVRVYTK